MIASPPNALIVAMVDKVGQHRPTAGQTHLHKGLFICEAMFSTPLDLQFKLHHYGPFSPVLEQRIQLLVRDSALAFVPQEPPLGPRLVTSEGAEVIREDHPALVAEHDATLEFVASVVGRRSIRDLERFATALWMIKAHGLTLAEDTAEAILAVKPHIAHDQALAAHHEVQAITRLASDRGLLEIRRPPAVAPATDRRPAPLLVDVASTGRPLRDDDLARWAATKTIFLSSEMRDLRSLRRRAAAALRALGFTVVLFEDLGGRDEDAEMAYLDGVRRSDIYVGIIARRYGAMAPHGRSATHDEYRAARHHGKRISVWVAADGKGRQGDATDFVQEIQTFHTTGEFGSAPDLIARLTDRLAEIAADDAAQWLRIGNVCFRAASVRDDGDSVVVKAEIRDPAVARALEDLQRVIGRPAPDVPFATARRAGVSQVTRIDIEHTSASRCQIEIQARWGAASQDPDHPSDDAVEQQLRAALIGVTSEDHPDRNAPPAPDLLASLTGLDLPYAAHEAVAGLLVAGWLHDHAGITRIERFSLGPLHLGERHVELAYGTSHDDASGHAETRVITGIRREPDTGRRGGA